MILNITIFAAKTIHALVYLNWCQFSMFLSIFLDFNIHCDSARECV